MTDTQPLRDVMTNDLVQVEAGLPVTEAARRMRERDIGDVLVTRDGALVGILTDRDVVVRCVAEGSDPASTPVEDVCSKEPTTLSPDDTMDVASRVMAKKAIRRIPIVEDGDRLVGIVSLGDIAEERDRATALGKISAAPANH